MIHWCQICHRYQGEIEPSQDYSLSFSPCANCTAAGRTENEEKSVRSEMLRNFYQRLRKSAKDGLLGEASGLLYEGKRLGLVPQDLMMGLLQPMLHEVGELWAHGELHVRQEHRISFAVSALFELFYAEFPEHSARRFAQHPDVLLMVSPSNRHFIGAQLVEYFLVAHDVTTHLVLPGLPPEEIVELACELQPRMIGISISLVSQLTEIRKVTELLAFAGLHETPHICVGGSPILAGNKLDSTGRMNVSELRAPDQLLQMLKHLPERATPRYQA